MGRYPTSCRCRNLRTKNSNELYFDMAKLKTLGQRIATIKKSISSPTTERIRGRTGMVMRERILKRDDYLCQECLAAGRVSVAQHVDHIVPLHRGGSNSESNQRSLCVECHDAKTRREEAERRGE